MSIILLLLFSSFYSPSFNLLQHNLHILIHFAYRYTSLLHAHLLSFTCIFPFLHFIILLLPFLFIHALIFCPFGKNFKLRLRVEEERKGKRSSCSAINHAFRMRCTCSCIRLPLLSYSFPFPRCVIQSVWSKGRGQASNGCNLFVRVGGKKGEAKKGGRRNCTYISFLWKNDRNEGRENWKSSDENSDGHRKEEEKNNCFRV